MSILSYLTLASNQRPALALSEFYPTQLTKASGSGAEFGRLLETLALQRSGSTRPFDQTSVSCNEIASTVLNAPRHSQAAHTTVPTPAPNDNGARIEPANVEKAASARALPLMRGLSGAEGSGRSMALPNHRTEGGIRNLSLAYGNAPDSSEHEGIVDRAAPPQFERARSKATPFVTLLAMESGLRVCAVAGELSQVERDRLRAAIRTLLIEHGFGEAELALNGEVTPPTHNTGALNG